MAHTNAHLWGDLADDEAAAALLDSAMSTIDNRVDYGDARLVEAEELRLYHQLGRDPDERLEKSIGIGVRVLVDGSWGFAAAPLSDAEVPARTAARAIAVARAGVGAGPRVAFPSRPAANGRYQTEVGRDPFAITTAERDTLLAEAIEAAAASRGVSSVTAGVNAKRQHRHFASTEGSLQHQHLIETGGGLTAIAANAHEVQRRSYPNSFHGNTGGSGWEFVLGLDLVGNGGRVGEEAVALLFAPMALAGVNDLVIGAQQVSLQIHESSGHALELDRILGDERNFAGTSFIQAGDVGTLRYGSPAVSIT
jgi:TldD protein